MIGSAPNQTKMKQLLSQLALGLLGGALAYGLLAGGSAMLGSTGAPATGYTHFQKESFREGLFAGTTNKFEVGNDGELSLNGLVTVVSAGTFANATTTLFAVQNPFSSLATTTAGRASGISATSTVDLVKIDITGISTTSVRLTVATSTLVKFAPATAADRNATTTSFFNKALLSAAGTATSTMYSGTLNSPYARNTDESQPGISSQARLLYGPNEHLVGWITANGEESLAGVTGGSNTFAGTYKIRWVK